MLDKHLVRWALGTAVLGAAVMYPTKYEACGILSVCQMCMRTLMLRNVTALGLTYFLIMSLSFCFTLSSLTFLLFSGFLLGQVGQKVQWWLRLRRRELAISAGVTGWAAAPIRLHLLSQIVLASLRLAQGKLVAVVQHVLEDLREESTLRVREEKKKGILFQRCWGGTGLRVQVPW